MRASARYLRMQEKCGNFLAIRFFYAIQWTHDAAKDPEAITLSGPFSEAATRAGFSLDNESYLVSAAVAIVRVSCPLGIRNQMMDTFQIKCINKTDRYNAHERI